MKRLFDLLFSGFALLLFALPMLLLVFLIGRKLGSPVFFVQTRPGLNGNPFKFYKFRTMTNNRYENRELPPDKDRLTKLGKFLRKTSLDELPSLWNVLKSDMSLVGPRPLLMEYLDRYSLKQARRHEVKPGITGWAQVNGRNAITWEEKFKFDVWYVDNQSFWLDIKILFMTVWKVLKGEGISHNMEATMPLFLGKK